jgi:mRNA interferase RelE/StbE
VWTVRIDPRAAKDIEALDRMAQTRVLKALRRLAEDPRRAPNVKALSGADGAYRLRVGDFRVIYTLRDAELLVFVVRVGHRREIYR